jgi:hypothetical protein
MTSVVPDFSKADATRKQGASKNRTDEVEIMSGAGWQTPSRNGKQPEGFGNVRKHNHDQAARADKLQNSPDCELPEREARKAWSIQKEGRVKLFIYQIIVRLRSFIASSVVPIRLLLEHDHAFSPEA